MKNKRILTFIVASLLIMVLPLNTYAWKTKRDRNEPSNIGGSKDINSQFVDKGLPAPIIDAPKPRPVPGRINIKYNGKYEYFYEKPLIVNERVLMPFRELFEFFDMEVSWNEADKKAVAVKDGKKIEIIKDSNKAYVDKEEKILDVLPTIINSKFYIPLRFIAESMNYNVSWDNQERTVIIDSRKEQN